MGWWLFDDRRASDRPLKGDDQTKQEQELVEYVQQRTLDLKKDQFIAITITYESPRSISQFQLHASGVLRNGLFNGSNPSSRVIEFIAPFTGAFEVIIQERKPRGDTPVALHVTVPRQPSAEDRLRDEANGLISRAEQWGPEDEPSAWEILKLRERAVALWTALEEPYLMAPSLYYLARAWEKCEEPELQLKNFLEAGRLFGRLELQKNEAVCTYETANNAMKLEHWELAFILFDRYLSSEGVSDKGRAYTLLDMTFAFRVNGAYQQEDEALKYVGDFLYSDKAFLETPEGKSMFSRYTNAKTHTLLLQNRTAEALKYQQLAIENYQGSDQATLSGMLDRLGQIYSLTGNWRESRKNHEEALDIIGTKPTMDRGAILNNLGLSLFRAKAFTEAKAKLEQALAISQLQGHPYKLLHVYRNLARVNYALNLKEQAKRDGQLALDLMVESRLSAHHAREFPHHMALRYSPLELMTDLLLDEKEPDLAEIEAFWAQMDVFRSLHLAEVLSMGPVLKHDGGTDLKTQISDLRLQNLEGKGQQEQLASLAQSYTEQWRSQKMTPSQPYDPDYAFGDLKSYFQDRKRRLLYYAFGENQLYLLTMRGGQWRYFNLGDRNHWEGEIFEYLRMLKAHPTIRPMDHLDPFERIISSLIPAVLQEEQGVLDWVIVADGSLHALPFAAIPLNDGGGYVADRFNLTFIPSIMSLKGINQKQRQPTQKMVIFADPEPTGHFSPLPRAREEAELIQKIVPNADVFLGPDARKKRLLSGPLGNYQWLHFATHGFLDEERGGLSILVLAGKDEQGQILDPYLYPSDIAALELQAELVVLGACESGLGQKIRGEGLVGLTQAFLEAGAANVLVCLWNVNDKATMVFMKAFYSHLKDKKLAPSEALRKAQMTLAQHELWKDPYYWAGFKLIGND